MNKIDNGSLQEANVPVNDVSEAKQVEGAQFEKPFSRLNRVLTEEELKSPGVRKLLIGQLDEYDQCKSDLADYRNKYHAKDKEAAILTEKIAGFITFEWLYSLLLSVGAILIGYYASQPDQGILLLIIGATSLILAVILKYMHSHENKI